MVEDTPVPEPVEASSDASLPEEKPITKTEDQGSEYEPPSETAPMPEDEQAVKDQVVELTEEKEPPKGK